MDSAAVADLVASLGGVATWGELRAAGRHAVHEACAAGLLIQVARGRYVHAATPEACRRAFAVAGIVSHGSAAQLCHWPLITPPTTVHVTLDRGRRCRQRGITAHYANLARADVAADRPVTTPLRTLLDCARTMPFRDTLALADAALRARHVAPDELCAAAASLRGPGRARAMRVSRHTDPRAASMLESACRALMIEAGLSFELQHRVHTWGGTYDIDLADRRHRVAVEAEGYDFHGGPADFERDARRYDELVLDGWLVLRFTYDQVLADPAWVLDCIRRALGQRRSRAASTAAG